MKLTSAPNFCTTVYIYAFIERACDTFLFFNVQRSSQIITYEFCNTIANVFARKFTFFLFTLFSDISYFNGETKFVSSAPTYVTRSCKNCQLIDFTVTEKNNVLL